MMQPIAVTAAHVNAVRGVEGVLRARRGTYVAGIGTLSMALYRDGVARWSAGDSDEVIGFGPAQSARNLIASRSSS